LSRFEFEFLSTKILSKFYLRKKKLDT